VFKIVFKIILIIYMRFENIPRFLVSLRLPWRDSLQYDNILNRSIVYQ